MPLRIKGQVYKAPGEDGEPTPTGEEIMAIEEHFDLDGFRLFATLVDPLKAPKGYTVAKALYATAWICRSRAGEVVSIADVLKDTSMDEIEDVAQDPKEEATKAPTES